MSGRKYRYEVRSRETRLFSTERHEIEETTIWDIVDRTTGKRVSIGWTTKEEALAAARTFEHQGEMGKNGEVHV